MQANRHELIKPFSRVLSQYTAYMRRVRGLPEKTIRGRIRYSTKFCHHLLRSGVKHLKAITRQVIQGFVIAEGHVYKRKTMVDYTSKLRSFLSFLYSRNIIPTDLSAVVVIPRLYQHENYPRYLTQQQITSILASIERKSPSGKRDYAIVLLLATYGLRAKEVITFKLEDIDWRNKCLHIRHRKANNNSLYPLTAEVGDAIVAYLKRGRPISSAYRNVFLSHRPPFKPLDALSPIVKNYVRFDCSHLDRLGSHNFRYSCAQKLFEHDFPLKTIADYLGHLDLNTTRRYMKIDLKHLREVALNDGEEIL